jgi:hypothetical protein
MGKRKISIQRTLGVKPTTLSHESSASAIDKLAGSMSMTDIGFRPTDQRVYEINLDRIFPDPSQPRRLLPHDLRDAVYNSDMSPSEAIRELVLRAEGDDVVSLLILGGKEKGPADENDSIVEDTGLLALAQSIREVGLRNPLNVYRADDPEKPDLVHYRLGEGERRFWAHHLLVLQGHEQFKSAKCIVESLPNDEELIHQRQEAENAARVDLPAIARARSMERLKERLSIEMGTRVPGENTIKLPSQRELQNAIGQRVKTFTGRAIGDRMVRNYLALLNLSPEAQDLAEAAQLTEKQLRPVMRLRTNDEQMAMIRRIVDEKWSGRQVLAEIATPSPIKSTLREIKQTTVEQRFEKRVLDAAKVMHSLSTLPRENYRDAVAGLAGRAKDAKMRQALQSLRQTLDEVLLLAENIASSEIELVSLISVIPPLDGLRRSLPKKDNAQLEQDTLTGKQILEKLLAWRNDDAVLASRLEPFFSQIESIAEKLRAGEYVPMPTLAAEESSIYPEMIVYKVLSEASVYWAHELLVFQGETQFKSIKQNLLAKILLEVDIRLIRDPASEVEPKVSIILC